MAKTWVEPFVHGDLGSFSLLLLSACTIVEGEEGGRGLFNRAVRVITAISGISVSALWAIATTNSCGTFGLVGVAMSSEEFPIDLHPNCVQLKPY